MPSNAIKSVETDLNCLQIYPLGQIETKIGRQILGKTAIVKTAMQIEGSAFDGLFSKLVGASIHAANWPSRF